MKRKVSLLASVLKERDDQKAERNQLPRGGKSRKPLPRNQCAYCKEKGHWKNKCPN